jgi:energy-coupling factor transport system ATP-binding protein
MVLKGKNGKGKSTLFKLMAGLLKPLEGEIRLIKDKQMIPSKKHYKEMGFIFQNPESHFFYDTIEEELRGLGNEYLQVLVKCFLKGIDLTRSPFLLSEGEKRRLSILMTVFHNKSIIFYDEPTFGQDKESILLIRSIVLELQKMGKLQFIISHDESFINSLNAAVYELVDLKLVGPL